MDSQDGSAAPPKQVTGHTDLCSTYEQSSTQKKHYQEK